MLGGWLVKNFGPGAVHLVCAAIGIIWLSLAVRIQAPPPRTT
jgi:hypothetical protein